MELNVPIRKVDVYQADDGRRVEVFKKTSEIKTEYPEDVSDQLTMSGEEIVYLGVVEMNFANGSKEIKFVIPDVTTLEDAFLKYEEIHPSIVRQVHEEIKKQQEASQSQIVEASEADLTAIQAMDTEEGIIVPE